MPPPEEPQPQDRHVGDGLQDPAATETQVTSLDDPTVGSSSAPATTKTSTQASHDKHHEPDSGFPTTGPHDTTSTANMDATREEEPLIRVGNQDQVMAEIAPDEEAPAALEISKGKQPDDNPATPTEPIDVDCSVATLKPPQTNNSEEQSRYLNPEPPNYVDPTPPTPTTSQPPSRTSSTAERSSLSEDRSPTRSDPDKKEKGNKSDDEADAGSQSEIQSIMTQFSEFGGGPDADEVMSPRLGIASPTFSYSSQHPPRKSSLEPITTSVSNQLQDFQNLRVAPSSPTSTRSKEHRAEEEAPPVPPKDGFFDTYPQSKEERSSETTAALSSPTTLHRPPPPEPEPEPALPFDFHRFLEQLRNKKADPVARYLKSFLSEFGKKQWMVHEQVKIISDFLAFIANKMAQCEVWRDVPDAEFDNAREGMEKLVMNRLYSQTFSPAIHPPKPIPGAKPKRKGGDPPLGPGRRGQHQEDVERDNVLSQKINIYGWVREEHLDIPAVGDSGRRFLKLAQQELLKIKSYRAPRDKIICVLNCCKVIFGLLKHNKSDSSADSFVPLLIYIVLQSNPEHLVSNLQYILRFRNQDKLGGEAGYYLSSLMGAVQFIENLDRTTLTITDDEFEKNVEAAVSAIAEKHAAESPNVPQKAQFAWDEKAPPPGASSSSTDSQRDSNGHPAEGDPESSENPAITGLLKSFQRPLTTIGRMFTEEGDPQPLPGQSAATQPPHPPRSQHPPSAGAQPNASSSSAARPPSRHALSAEEAAARQASAEAAEAQRLQRAEHVNVVETLAGMFPDLDKDVISDVVHQKEGRVGLAVDACLALSA